MALAYAQVCPNWLTAAVMSLTLIAPSGGRRFQTLGSELPPRSYEGW